MRLSLKAKILLPPVLGALLLAAAACVVSTIGLRRITDDRFLADFGNRIATIKSFLTAQQKELDATGMVETYEEQFRKNAIESLRSQYYKEGQGDGFYPFIIDATKRTVVLHPTLKAGDASLAEADFVKRMSELKKGEQQYQGPGSPDRLPLIAPGANRRISLRVLSV
jgi:hypothetical protein